MRKRHRTDTTRSLMTDGRIHGVSNGAATSSSFPSSSPLSQHPLSLRDAPTPRDTPTPTTGIFTGPVDVVDMITRSGSFVFLSDLLDTERLFELRDFRIDRVMSKDESIEQYATTMHLVLDLADKYPHDSLSTHILDVVWFLPV